MTHRLYIEEVRQGTHNPVYDVSYSLLRGTEKHLKGVREPITTGAREMLSDGLHGEVELWDRLREYPRAKGDILTLSKLTVQESAQRGPTFAKYVNNFS